MFPVSSSVVTSWGRITWVLHTWLRRVFPLLFYSSWHLQPSARLTDACECCQGGSLILERGGIFEYIYKENIYVIYYKDIHHLYYFITITLSIYFLLENFDYWLFETVISLSFEWYEFIFYIYKEYIYFIYYIDIYHIYWFIKINFIYLILTSHCKLLTICSSNYYIVTINFFIYICDKDICYLQYWLNIQFIIIFMYFYYFFS